MWDFLPYPAPLGLRAGEPFETADDAERAALRPSRRGLRRVRTDIDAAVGWVLLLAAAWLAATVSGAAGFGGALCSYRCSFSGWGPARRSRS